MRGILRLCLPACLAAFFFAYPASATPVLDLPAQEQARRMEAERQQELARKKQMDRQERQAQKNQTTRQEFKKRSKQAPKNKGRQARKRRPEAAAESLQPEGAQKAAHLSEAILGAGGHALAFSGNAGETLVHLHLFPDAFFVLSLEGRRKRHISGRWRTSSDGVAIDLHNAQDLRLGLSVGKDRLYATFGDIGLGGAELLPIRFKEPTFSLGGYLQPESCNFEDVASGKVFAPANAQVCAGLPRGAPLFAEAEISGGKTVKILSFSTHLPRFATARLQSPQNQKMHSGGGNFTQGVCGMYWLLPKLPGVEKAAARFAPPSDRQKNRLSKAQEAAIAGSVEISGPGLRAEGFWSECDGHLSITLNNGSLRNLKKIGADALAKEFTGKFAWSLNGEDALILEKEHGRRFMLRPAGGR